MRVRRHRVAAMAVGVTLTLGLVPTPVDAARPAGAAPPPAARVPADRQVEQIENLLPPGARQVVSVFRIFKGLAARNRVYREAHAVQRDVRASYDARIAKAQEQLLNREILGLEPSQVRAYTRVKAMLEAERDEAIDDTELEKRIAKYGFESALARELGAAVVRIPRVGAGLARMREAVQDLQTKLQAVQQAVESGNPVAGLLDEIESKAAEVERFGEIAGVLSGAAGRRIQGLADGIRARVAPVREALGEAAGAIGEISNELSEADALLEEAAAPAAPRASLDVAPDGGTLLDDLAAAAGANPAVSAAATVIARQAFQRAGEEPRTIERQRFNRMRDRVQAAMLDRTLERIAGICGRLVGAARRAQLEAAAAGDAAPDTSTPCTLFGNPDALQALIDAERVGGDDDATESSTTGPLPTDPSVAPPGDERADAIDTFCGHWRELWQIVIDGADEVSAIYANSGPDGPPAGATDHIYEHGEAATSALLVEIAALEIEPIADVAVRAADHGFVGVFSSPDGASDAFLNDIDALDAFSSERCGFDSASLASG